MTYEQMKREARNIAGKASFGLFEATYDRAMKELIQAEIAAKTKALREENARLKSQTQNMEFK